MRISGLVGKWVSGLAGLLEFKKFSFKKSVAVVEVGNDWIKIAESVFSAGRATIFKASFIKLAEIEGSIAVAIAKVFKDMKINKAPVITYIPRHLATTRILNLPSTDPAEINDMVSLQVGKQTPYSKEEIVFAHKIIDGMKEGYTKVMLVIVRQNIISNRLEILQEVGIQAARVTLSTEGVYNWFNISYPKEAKSTSETIILLDIDSNFSDFIIIRKGKLLFTRNILIGANQLLEEPDKWRDKYIEEIKHSIGLYQNEDRDAKINRMFLSGSARNINYLDSVLSATLDMPTVSTDQFSNLEINNDIKILRDDNYKHISMSALFGIAISGKQAGLDLTPGEMCIRKHMEIKRKDLTVTGILSVAIIMLISMLLITNIYNKNLYLTQLKNKIMQVEKSADEVEKMRARINLIEKRLDARGSSINMLTEISKLTPGTISLTLIDIEEKQKVVLKGRTPAMSDVFKFVTILENSPMFMNVKPTYATTQKDQAGEYAEFEITAVYKREK